jgi:hypothetical protein
MPPNELVVRTTLPSSTRTEPERSLCGLATERS